MPEVRAYEIVHIGDGEFNISEGASSAVFDVARGAVMLF